MHGFKNLFITTAELSLTAHLTVHLPRISYFTPSERVSYSRISTYGLYHKLNYFYCPNFMCVSLWILSNMICFLRLHVQLMDLQQKQINALAEWLTLAEQRINSSEPIGSDLDTVKRQVENHKVWHLIPLLPFYTPVVIGVYGCSRVTVFSQVPRRCTVCQIMEFIANTSKVRRRQEFPTSALSPFTLPSVPSSPPVIRRSFQWQTY